MQTINPDGYTTNSTLTKYLTTNTAQDISGHKHSWVKEQYISSKMQ